MHLSTITARLLEQARIKPGMRVLDIGCGSGEVTRAVGALVGEAGCVIGLDESESALALAKAAAHSAGATNTSYVHSNLSELHLEEGLFDCIVGRRVLMYLRDPERVLSSLAKLLRPAGVMAFQEHDVSMTRGRHGHWPLHDQVHHWIWETVRREGADPNIGLALAPMLERVGLDVEALWGQVIFAGYEAGIHHPLAEVVQFVHSRIVAQGVANAAQIDIATLRERLENERRGQRSTYASDVAVCVVARHRN